MLSALIKVRDTREEIILEIDNMRAYKKDGKYTEVTLFYVNQSGEGPATGWGLYADEDPNKIKQDIYIMNDSGQTIATYHL